MWSLALDERKSLLDVELQKPNNDSIREAALFHQVAVLAEERNSVLVPQSKSGMPGAPEPEYATLPPGQEVRLPGGHFVRIPNEKTQSTLLFDQFYSRSYSTMNYHLFEQKIKIRKTRI